jgi:MoxR-like ATPase
MAVMEPIKRGDGDSLADWLRRLADNVTSVLLDKQEAVRLALIVLLAEGHLLIEDVPGTGKTLLAKALARSLDCSFSRIQFTPDLLPGDLLGTNIFRQDSGSFQFYRGPVFAHVVLADEINRATPRTQSALLEAMSERQVTLENQTHPLPPPFLVLATQNPYEFEGTYPLPESQLDRFLIRMRLGYPSFAEELRVLSGHRQGEPVDRLGAVVTTAQLLALQEATRLVRVDDSIAHYLLRLIHATRQHPEIALGASTRAALALYRAGQASALTEGRNFVVPDDVKRLAVPVLAHRLLLRHASHTGFSAAEATVASIVEETIVPA